MKKLILTALIVGASLFISSYAYAGPVGKVFSVLLAIGERESVGEGKAIGSLFSKEAHVPESVPEPHEDIATSEKTKKSELDVSDLIPNTSQTSKDDETRADNELRKELGSDYIEDSPKTSTSDKSYIGRAVGIYAGGNNNDDDKNRK